MTLDLKLVLVAVPLSVFACATPESAKPGEPSAVPTAKPSGDLPYVAPAILPDAGQPDASMDAELGVDPSTRR
ncbi:MAG: hypothetical protein H6718_19780 [Polyangiaceae bacterium]|nr:hypothetical protein [Myxococcales bacterium]MCB9587653.1 hypothetical protein [Polyangiaceae bacterium]MCB9605549.1 hypothetical protein [Polyangiaceae bacterium]